MEQLERQNQSVYRQNNVAPDGIRSIDLFKDLSGAELERLTKLASLRQLSSKKVFMKEGARVTVLYSLIEGTVELFSEYDNQRCTVAIVRSGSPCALTSIFQGRNPLSARSLGRGLLLVIPARLILDLTEENAAFRQAAVHQLVSESHNTLELLKARSLRTGSERLVEWILQFDRTTEWAGHFILPCDKRTLAAYLGMAPENLSRTLAALAPAIVVRGRSIAIKDREALVARAGNGKFLPG